jgi:ubiquinone biosynthesis protein UbiJ
MTAVAVIHRDLVLERIRAGHKLIDIAADLGLSSHAAIINALGNDPEYHDARKVAVEVRIEKREGELEVAGDSVTVARARELLSHARWRAEREFPDRWGQRNHVTVDHRSDLGDRLRKARNREQVIDGERVADTPKPQRTSDDNVQDV